MPLYYNNTDLQTIDVTFITEHKEIFGNLNVFVTNAPFIQDLEVIKKINESMDIVVYTQMTHPHCFRSIEEHFSRVNINKPWVRISWDTDLPNTKNYFVFNYWATNIMDSMYELWDQSKYQTPTTNKRKFLYSCLNYIVKAHRVCILIGLFYSKYYNNCLISMSKTTGIPEGIPVTKEYVIRDIRTFFPKYNEQQIINFYNTLPQVYKNEENGRISFWIHDAYINSYVNIVTEHNFVSKFFSEKSIKPFLTEQIAIFVAGPGTVELIRKVGIDVFDDIVDHNYYDTELDPVYRLEKIYELLNKMSGWNWEKIYQDTEHRRKANREFLLSGRLVEKFRENLMT